MASEEVQRVVDALNALEGIELGPDDDPAKIAHELTKALDRWPDRHKQLRELRRQAVLRLRAQEKSWQEIGNIMGGLSHVRAQQIAKGSTGPQGVEARERRKKAMRKPEEEPPPDEE